MTSRIMTRANENSSSVIAKTTTALMITACMLLLYSLPAYAVSSRTWRQRERVDFEKGEPTNVAFSSDGTVRLAPQIDLLYEAEQPYIWALAQDEDGAIYASGGNEGIIYRVHPSGESKIFFQAKEPEVHALAIDAEGFVYAGTAPDARIYKIDPHGELLWVAETGEEYVWALIADDMGNLFAGTGVEGRVIKVTPSGQSEIFFDSADTHIRTLMQDGYGNLLAGTDGHGLVFRIGPTGEGFVVYDAPLDEVVSMVAMEDGTIYTSVAGGAGPRARRGEKPPAPPPRDVREPSADGPREEGEPSGSSSRDDGGDRRQVAEQQVRLQMEGKVLMISPDGYGREIWAGKQEVVLSLAVSSGGKLVLGSSVDGRIYELEESGALREIGRAPSSQVTALAARGSRPGMGAGPDEIVVAGSNLGTVSILRGGYARTGGLESLPLDAQSFATWGRITWRAETPRGTRVIVQGRSGNTETPDRTWSEWGEELSDPRGITLDLPAARFLQWRAVLETNDPERTPALHEVSVTYLQRNLPPEIRTIAVQEPGIAYQKVTSPHPRAGPETGGAPSSAMGEGAARRGKRPQPRRSFQAGARSISWQAVDANDDRLVYDVYYRAVDESYWKRIRNDIEESFVTLDTHAMPDGTYLVRVVASDAPSNPPEDALTAERLTSYFDVDNTPPRVERLKADPVSPGVRLTFTVSDTFGIVREAAYAVDAGDWIEARPEDGMHDDLIETYDLTVEELPPGEHSIVVRAADAAGNVGSGRALVEIP